MLARVFRDQAVFVDFGRPVQKHYTARSTPFLWDELVLDAQRLVSMPIQSFFRLAEDMPAAAKIDNRQEDLTLLFGTGRCGSTLMANIVDFADPECLVLSEPVPFIDIYRSHQRVPPAEFRKIVSSTLRLLCKPFPGVKRYFFKPVCIPIPLAREVNRFVPRSRVLYCYRDPLKTSWAHERAFGMTPAYQLYKVFQWLCLLDHFEQYSGLHPNYRMDELGYKYFGRINTFQVCFLMWTAHHLSYTEQAKEFNFPKICYDDVFRNPVQFCRNVLEMSGYDLESRPELLDKAMDALNVDSQGGRTTSQSQLQGFPSTKMTPELWEKVSGLSKELGLPLPTFYTETFKKESDRLFTSAHQSSVAPLKVVQKNFHGKNGFHRLANGVAAKA